MSTGIDCSLRDAALLLLGHGSTLNADSSAPTYQHAEEIRRRGIFEEVHVAFWKEEPNFRQALRQTHCRQVYVVPNFISSGYFTEQIIPRELGLQGPLTRLDGQDIFYCEPVGLHPSMTEVLLRRAGEVVSSSREKIDNPARTACLFICGHGTSLNDNSTKIIHEQATLIRSRGIYADCQAVLMEQSPYVKDWRTLTECPDVVVVPFFIADGLHSFEDIPVLLGLTRNLKEKDFTNPQCENGRRLWYATAIGTEKFIADVILGQVEQFQANHGENEVFIKTDGAASPIHVELERFFRNNSSPWKIGEIVVRGHGDSFELLHSADLDTDVRNLRAIAAPVELRDLIRLDDLGRYRPLRAAPNLPRGWCHHAATLSDVQLALDYLYPAELANWHLWIHGKLSTTTWRETAERQSGRYRIMRGINDEAIQELVAKVCTPGCLKRRLWLPAVQTVQPGAQEIPLICPEACNFLVEQAHTSLKGIPPEDV